MNIRVILIVVCFLFSSFLCSAQSDNSIRPRPKNDSQKAEDPQTEDAKKYNYPPVLNLNADRDLIVKLLMQQMTENEFRLTKKETDVLVFEKRIPGAEAAIKRNSYDRSTMTPIIDDPKMIVAVGLEPKSNGTLVVARMMMTTVISSTVLRRDVTEKVTGRIILNKILEQLKLNLEKEQTKK